MAPPKNCTITGCLNLLQFATIYLLLLTNFCSAMVMTTDRKSIYCCTMNNCYQVSHYQLSEDSQVWTKVEDLPRTDNDVTEMMLQLKFDKNDTILLGQYWK